MTTARCMASTVYVFALLATSSARADTSNAAAAEALFDEGRRLVKDGHHVEACQKFEASQRLDPGVGTLLNLGECFEHVGRTASAWARFREAASLAAASSQREREQVARGRAAALEGRLIRLAIRPSSAGVDVKIARDGVVLEREAWGTAVPVDPGKHAISASAPGKVGWSTELWLDGAQPGVTRTVEVPLLADRPPPPFWNGQRTVSVISFGVGLAATAVGTGLAIHAESTYAAALERCTANGCDSGARAQGASAGSSADVATGLFIGGAVALVAGVVLFVTAPRAAKDLRALGFSPVVAQ